MIKPSDLKSFQTRAAAELALMIKEYPSPRFKPRFDPDTGERLPFLCRLRAITGAGKTPILATTARQLDRGIILWTTNRGAIISQTLHNLRPGGKYSELLPEGTQVLTLGEMTNADWTEVLESKEGLTILLSTVASFNQDGDNLRIHKKIGDHTRWQLLAGSVDGGRERPLFVFYDEGHGATENQFRKLRELMPGAFVLASASPLPEDLADLLSGSTPQDRGKALADRTVVVPTNEVVVEGLLKQRLYFVDCNTAATDALREANDKWLQLSDKLRPHGRVPIACFIVNDTARGVDVWEQLVELGVPEAKIAVHLNGARDVIADRRGETARLIDTYTGRKAGDRAPEALARAGYTHIIWNLTLREGWDEPLAYVAYIDSRGRSASDIVQKIGRFVRQPDAKQFKDDDLNSAYFYFNVTDEAFTDIIEQTQREMETEGYEVIAMDSTRRPPVSRRVEPRHEAHVPKIGAWFGDDIKRRDQIILNNVPLFAKEALEATGTFKTRVFEMKELREDQSKRTERSHEANDVITPWEYLSTRLGAIDPRIINATGSIFSATLKDDVRLNQEMQHGSEAMTVLARSLGVIRDELNDLFALHGFGKHGRQLVGSFSLVSPNIETMNEMYRNKYRVHSFDNSVHAEYNGLNPFELDVAKALDRTGKLWCRNPVAGEGYRIPMQELGAENIWFYPDFLFWPNDDEVWAIDPKGKHLLEAAVANKLLDLSALNDVSPKLRIAFIVEGKIEINTQGGFSKMGKDGYSLVRKVGTRARATIFSNLEKLVSSLM